jgi:hypothetical protein
MSRKECETKLRSKKNSSRYNETNRSIKNPCEINSRMDIIISRLRGIEAKKKSNWSTYVTLKQKLLCINSVLKKTMLRFIQSEWMHS